MPKHLGVAVGSPVAAGVGRNRPRHRDSADAGPDHVTHEQVDTSLL